MGRLLNFSFSVPLHKITYLKKKGIVSVSDFLVLIFCGVMFIISREYITEKKKRSRKEKINEQIS